MTQEVNLVEKTEKSSQFEIYAVDCETTGVRYELHSPIEISIVRFSTKEQKTWYLKPLDTAHISTEALRKNGYLLEDLLHKTKEGREKFREVQDVLIEIENWVAEDNASSEDRILLGHNVAFDKDMLFYLWERSNAGDSFPFNFRRKIDTMELEWNMDFAQGKMAEGYSLNNLCKKYGIKNDKAHKADSDIRATVEIYQKQIKVLKNLFKNE